ADADPRRPVEPGLSRTRGPPRRARRDRVLRPRRDDGFLRPRSGDEVTMRRALLVCGLIALVLPLVALADSPPVITVPPDMTVEAQNFSGATVTYTASAVDDHGEPVQVACNPPSGSVFGFGATTVTCTARAHGESATKRFKVTVVDTVPPAITVPAALQLTTTARQGK